MAGIQADRGDTRHLIVSGEVPVVGMKVYTNEYKQGTITFIPERGTDEPCGWYCPRWVEVTYPDGRSVSMNCDRLSTRLPR